MEAEISMRDIATRKKFRSHSKFWNQTRAYIIENG